MKITTREGNLLRYHENNDANQSIWFVHGFGDSGLVFIEVFQSVLKDHYGLYVIDLPGFGSSPKNPDCITLKDQSEMVTRLITKEHQDPDHKIIVVAHSISGLIGTWVCQKLGELIHYFVNIEGNLTEADGYFSSKPLAYDHPLDFYEAFEKEIFEKARHNESYRRYYSSLRFADPEVMRAWSTSSQEYLVGNQAGKEFQSLNCKKIYIWGDQDTSAESQEFILSNQIPNKMYPGTSHWVMVEKPDEFYNHLFKLLT